MKVMKDARTTTHPHPPSGELGMVVSEEEEDEEEEEELEE